MREMRGTLQTWLTRGFAACGVIGAAWLVYPSLRSVLLEIEETPAARGMQLADDLGCFACHGPAGMGGVKNPGSREGEVPAFVEQTQMMYVTSTDELREYVLDGMPERRRGDPDYLAEVEAALERIAYRVLVQRHWADDLEPVPTGSAGG
jgi:mono/diheme cytochrome c family protein